MFTKLKTTVLANSQNRVRSLTDYFSTLPTSTLCISPCIRRIQYYSLVPSGLTWTRRVSTRTRRCGRPWSRLTSRATSPTWRRGSTTSAAKMEKISGENMCIYQIQTKGYLKCKFKVQIHYAQTKGTQHKSTVRSTSIKTNGGTSWSIHNIKSF